MLTLCRGQGNAHPDWRGFPGSTQHPICRYPFDRHHHVRTTQNRPPACTPAVQPSHSGKPSGVLKCGSPAAETTDLHLKTQQPEPIAQSPVSDQPTHAFGHVVVPAQPTIQGLSTLVPTPQTHRIQSGDDHMALGHQHPLYFTQSGMRICTQLQSMRHDHQIQTVDCKRQGRAIGHEVAWQPGRVPQTVPRLCPRTGLPTMRHAVGQQTVQFWGIELQGVVAKNVNHSGIQLVLFPSVQVTPQRRCQPLTPSLRYPRGCARE